MRTQYLLILLFLFCSSFSNGQNGDTFSINPTDSIIFQDTSKSPINPDQWVIDTTLHSYKTSPDERELIRKKNMTGGEHYFIDSLGNKITDEEFESYLKSKYNFPFYLELKCFVDWTGKIKTVYLSELKDTTGKTLRADLTRKIDFNEIIRHSAFTRTHFRVLFYCDNDHAICTIFTGDRHDTENKK